MKKLLTLCLVLTFILSFSFIGCNKSGKWQEVQSITYTTTTGTTTFTSKFIWDLEQEYISEEEWNNAPQDFKRRYIEDLTNIRQPSISKNRKEDIKESTYQINKKYYDKCISTYGGLAPEEYTYYTIFYKSFEIKYVKIKLHTDGSFELNYGDEYTRILPTTYKITYFEN